MPHLPTDPILSLLELAAAGRGATWSAASGCWAADLEDGPRILRLSYYPASNDFVWSGFDAERRVADQLVQMGAYRAAEPATILRELHGLLVWLRGEPAGPEPPGETWRDRAIRDPIF